MNADEYEARLRDEVIDAATDYEGGIIGPPLNAYADWLRLRAVAEQACNEELCRPWKVPVRLCPPCEAQQKLDAILAEGSTG